MSSTNEKSDATTALAELLEMDEADRISAVAEDLRTGRDRYRGIAPDDLATALGVPAPSVDADADWLHFSYVEKVPISKMLAGGIEPDGILHLASSLMTPQRYEALLQATDEGSVDLPDGFLTDDEDTALGAAYARDKLTDGMSEYLPGYAQYWLATEGGEPLGFETRICDWGELSYFLGPYDKRYGKFTGTPSSSFVLFHNNDSVEET